MELVEYFIISLLPQNKILSVIVYYIALFTYSILFVTVMVFICQGFTFQDPSQERRVLTANSQTATPRAHIRKNSSLSNKHSRLEDRDEKRAAEEGSALNAFRDIYRGRGLEDACLLDTSESDVDERDSLLLQMKDELSNIGYRRPTCETDGEE